MDALTQYTHWDEDEIELTTLRKIAYAKELYDAQVRETEKAEYIKKVLLQDYVNQIRQHMSRYDYFGEHIRKAQKEVGERLKKDRPHLETIKRFLMDDFLNNDKTFKLVKIISGGYEGYYWRFEFTGYGKTIYIEVPVMARLTPENVHHANYGMFAFGVYESEYCYHMVKGTYEMKELAATIKEWVERERKKGSVEKRKSNEDLGVEE